MVLQDHLNFDSDDEDFAALEEFVGERKRLIEVAARENKILAPHNLAQFHLLKIVSPSWIFMSSHPFSLLGGGIFSAVKMSQGKLPLHPS